MPQSPLLYACSKLVQSFTSTVRLRQACVVVRNVAATSAELLQHMAAVLLGMVLFFMAGGCLAAGASCRHQRPRWQVKHSTTITYLLLARAVWPLFSFVSALPRSSFPSHAHPLSFCCCVCMHASCGVPWSCWALHQAQIINQNGATSGFELCFATSTLGARGPNQNTSRIQHKEVLARKLGFCLKLPLFEEAPSVKKFIPHLVYDWALCRSGLGRSTAVHRAAVCGHAEMVQILLKVPTLTHNISPFDPCTPCCMAPTVVLPPVVFFHTNMIKNCEHCIKYVVEQASAQPHLQDTDGRTALHKARQAPRHHSTTVSHAPLQVPCTTPPHAPCAGSTGHR